MPNAIAVICQYGASRSLTNAVNPLASSSAMPNTRWWTCTPPAFTLPGHHGTFGLRISRVDVRMNVNEMRNASSTRNADSRPGSGAELNRSSAATITRVVESTLAGGLLHDVPRAADQRDRAGHVRLDRRAAVAAA